MSIALHEPILDPQRDVAGGSATLTQALFSGLMRLDPATGEALPDLAAEPPAVSHDGLTYTFAIRPDAIWITQDGQPAAPLHAEDVVFTIRRLCDNTTDRRLAQLFYIIKNCAAANTAEGTADLEVIAVRAVDERTVEFTLTEPAAWFASMLTHWAARPLPRAIVTGNPDWTTSGPLLTSGPYLLADLKPGVGAVLVKNPLFYDSAAVAINRVNLVFNPDPAQALTAYVRNELDTSPIPLSLLERVRTDPLFEDQLRVRSTLCTDYLGFTTVKGPVNSREVRLALSLAIDRPTLSRLIYGGAAVPARHLSPLGVLGAPPPDKVGVQTDLSEGSATLARAGYPDGAGFPPITLLVMEGERNRQLGALVQEGWHTTLGIDVQLEVLPSEAFFQRLNRTTPLPSAPHVWLFSHCADFPDAYNFLGPTFHVVESPNYARRVATRFEEALDEAAATLDLDTRRQRYAEAEEQLAVVEVAYAPLVHHVNHLVVKPWLTRDVRPFGGLQLRDWSINMVAKEAERERAG